MRVVELGMMDFEVAENRRGFMKTDEHIFHLPVASNDSLAIFTYYARPSNVKVRIWNDWIDWAKLNKAELWITSANCMRFTISGRIIINGQWWNLRITADHNRATPVRAV